MMLLAVLCAVMVTAAAQRVYGDKKGWTVYTTTDEYSGRKSHCLRYYNEQLELAASFWPGTDRLAILEWYDGRLYFDVTFDAVTDHRGHIAEEEISYEVRVALPKGESAEDFGTVALKFMDVEKAGETFFGTFIFNADGNAMKAGQTLAVKWNDPIKGKQIVRKLSLAGFTRCYDECLRRYGVKKK